MCIPNEPPVEKHIYQYGRVHCAIGYALSNSSLIEVDGGYVLVDTLPSLSAAREVKREFETRVSGEVQTIIYTHSHTDHIRGTAAFADPGVPIWAHESFFEELEHVYRLSRFHYRRGAKQFGYGLKDMNTGGYEVSNGIGPPLAMDEGAVPPIRVPTHVFRDDAEFEIGGVPIELHHAPGETRDQLFVWLPDDRVLLAADNIYRAFPNLYAIRGVRSRPVDAWIRSLDRMRRLEPVPECLVLGHTEPVEGAEQIHQLLTDYRDAIAYVHDSVVRMINDERTPDEMVREIRLPSHLSGHPYLAERYGTLEGAIRGIYHSYVGWFDGDGANLLPCTPAELGGRLIALAGGRSKVTDAIEHALSDGDPSWAAWLAGQLLAVDSHDTAASSLKAQALRKMAHQTANPLNRNWLHSDAAQLDATYRLPERAQMNGDTIEYLPIETIMRILPQRLDPVRSADVTAAFSFEFTDSGKCFTLLVRRGVGEIVERCVAEPFLLVKTTERDFKRGIVAREYPRFSRRFWQSIALVVPGSSALAPFRKLRRLAQLGRMMNKP